MSKDDSVYPAAQRRRLRWAAALGLAAALSLPSVLVAVALVVLDLPRQFHPYGLGAAALITLVLFPLAANRTPLIGNRAVRAAVVAKLAQTEEGKAFVEGAVFVGFSPTDAVLLWDGESDWDVGMLATTGDALAYQGDRMRWSLPREAIQSVDASPGPEPARVLVQWRLGPAEHGTLALAPREARTIADMERARRQLLVRIEAWRAQTDGTPGPRWGPPPADPEGGRPAGQVTAWGCLGSLAVLVIAGTTWMLTGWPNYTAGLTHLALLQAAAIGLPTLVVVSEMLPSGVE